MYEEQSRLKLNPLNQDSSDAGIDLSDIVTTDGLSMAVWSPDDADKDCIGPMCAGVFAFSESIAKEFDMGDLGQVIVKGSKGSALINFASELTILTLNIKPNSKKDQAGEFARHTAKELQPMMM